MSCVKCGGDLKFNDNSIERIKNSEGFVEIYPIGYCKICDIYYSDEADGLGLTNKINKRFIKHLGCDKWFENKGEKQHD